MKDYLECIYREKVDEVDVYDHDQIKKLKKFLKDVILSR